jgi:hypothetical protein
VKFARRKAERNKGHEALHEFQRVIRAVRLLILIVAKRKNRENVEKI